MHKQTVLNKVLRLLNFEKDIKLETAVLSDGATIQADVWEVGAEVFLVGEEDALIPLPIGSYIIDSGETLVVEIEGIIASFEKVEEVAPEEEVVAPVEELETETPTENKPVKKVIESISKETFFEEMKKRDDKIEALELALTVKVEEEKTVEVEETKTVEMESEKIVHSPEKEVSTKEINMNKANTIQGRILSRYQKRN